mgnify:CR=1 FL=1
MGGAHRDAPRRLTARRETRALNPPAPAQGDCTPPATPVEACERMLY